MKILKKILIALGVLILLYSLISLFLPSKKMIERSTMINAPAAVVFEQINNLQNWKSWSYWDNIDPAMKSSWEGPGAGVGAKHIWSSENDNVGHGSLTITESKPNELVVTELSFEGMGTSLGGWKIKDTTGGTYVTTYMDIDCGFFGRIFPGLMMDSWLGGDFEKTLAGLKKRCEELASTPAEAEYKVEIVNISSQPIVTTRMITNEKTISADIGACYHKIGMYIQKNKLNMAGPVFAFYHDLHKIDMECAVPVDKTAKSEGDVTATEMKAGNAASADYYGDYMKTEKAHNAIKKWIADNNKKISGSPWEVYITDPMVEKDTAKWLTKIYYPVE
jgi:effector-binding domain-containing protein